ncbi:hypothetical protein TW81_18005 [Vibrio galatheae]|uniref:Diguanylate cyclase n=1 Tax=Vibrio galatheae TaxID=579748 RepID=A0A0F4NEE2_9VIBR|nr:sensor domain-containing diguanylate cyclase [Vibrio galatheae]KJY81450.1 hypothetical protein TW81_18005 [Vibrio galatheae]
MNNNDDQRLKDSIYRLFEVTPVPTIFTYPDGNLEYVNPALKKMLGYDGDEIYASNVVITHHQDLQLNERIRQQLNQPPFEPVQIEKRYKHKRGHTVYAQLNVVAQPDENDRVVRYISQLVDLTSIKKLYAAEVLLNKLVDQSNDAIYIVDPRFGQILNSNKPAYEMLGYSKEELLSMTVSDINPQYVTQLNWKDKIESIKRRESNVYESVLQKKDGTIFPTEVSVSYVELNQQSYILSIVRDISDRKEKELESLELANLDPLTQLPNRRVLDTKLREIFQQADEQEHMVGLIFIDIDDFKDINDRYGHSEGDIVLANIAKRLTHSLRQSDLVARIGGDEFLAVINGVSNKEHLNTLVTKLSNEFCFPFKTESRMLNVDVSIGVSIYPYDSHDPVALIRYADEAMYQAKKNLGTSIRQYGSSVDK